MLVPNFCLDLHRCRPRMTPVGEKVTNPRSAPGPIDSVTAASRPGDQRLCRRGPAVTTLRRGARSKVARVPISPTPAAEGMRP
ncbi:hypothetical protein RHA1_ro00020 [Rhodococcus jostii RHA1]|uniref:Uncharacterized protein n=1 Tax=Rhodococcus jostii (strain RHA1) TaxID=101510 RepID=Q0SKT0_RHOJR|nr:hypothetical protein RHA1_ro00020 [Rhodococcus jostii RHA1]